MIALLVALAFGALQARAPAFAAGPACPDLSGLYRCSPKDKPDQFRRIKSSATEITITADNKPTRLKLNESIKVGGYGWGAEMRVDCLPEGFRYTIRPEKEPKVTLLYLKTKEGLAVIPTDGSPTYCSKVQE